MIVTIELTRKDVERIVRDHATANLLPPDHEIDSAELKYSNMFEIKISPKVDSTEEPAA